MCGIIGTLLGGLLGQKSTNVSTPTITAPPTSVDVTSGTESLEAGKSAKQKAASATGYQSTVKTSSSGDTSTATTNKKALLGG
jgi:hypothetical protein